MSSKIFPVQRPTVCVIVTLVVAFLAAQVPLPSNRCSVFVALRGTSISHVRNAFGKELVNVYSCACVAQNELVGLAICDIGNVDKQSRIESRIVCLLDAVEDVVRLPHSLSEPAVVGLEDLVAVFCSGQLWPHKSQRQCSPTIEVPLQRTTLPLNCPSLLGILIRIKIPCESIFFLIHRFIVRRTCRIRLLGPSPFVCS
jgi:hypothetical protein